MATIINLDLEPLGGGTGVEPTPARQALDDLGYYDDPNGDLSPVTSIPATISGAYAEGEAKYYPTSLSLSGSSLRSGCLVLPKARW
jgi:hypothetical protein